MDGMNRNKGALMSSIVALTLSYGAHNPRFLASDTMLIWGADGTEC
jgi:hypothetical protein